MWLLSNVVSMLCCWFIQIGPIEQVMVRDVRNTTDRQNFKLKDDTDSIRICMWGEETKQCVGLSAGDIIKVINLKTNKYYEDVSLNSTILTKIQKVVVIICSCQKTQVS